MEVFVIFLSPSWYRRMPRQPHKLGHGRFLPHPFQFISHLIILSLEVKYLKTFRRREQACFKTINLVRSMESVRRSFIIHANYNISSQFKESPYWIRRGISLRVKESEYLLRYMNEVQYTSFETPYSVFWNIRFSSSQISLSFSIPFCRIRKIRIRIQLQIHFLTEYVTSYAPEVNTNWYLTIYILNNYKWELQTTNEV
jgi:hypothetical protein